MFHVKQLIEGLSSVYMLINAEGDVNINMRKNNAANGIIAHGCGYMYVSRETIVVLQHAKKPS